MMILPSLLVLVSLATPPTSGPTAEARLPTSLDFNAARALVVQHDGRWMPLDTVARDLVYQVSGDKWFRTADPVALLLAWTFEREAWMEHPMIRLGNAEVRSNLGLPAQRTTFSFRDLVSHEKFLTLLSDLEQNPPSGKPDPLQSKLLDLRDRLLTLQQAFAGQAIRLIPDPANATGAWRPIRAEGPTQSEPEGNAREAWMAMGQAFSDDDAPAFRAAVGRLSDALALLPAGHRPDSSLIQTELRYNRMQPFRTSWVIMTAGAILAGIGLGVRRRWFDGLIVLVLAAGFAMATSGLGLRWQIAGRIPASDMYESLLFLGWGVGLFAIATPLLFKQRIVLVTAAGTAALALLLADVLPLDPFVRPIVPVLLDTVWMSIHVPVIMVSYSVLAIGVLMAHVQLFVLALAPGRRAFSAAIDDLHYWYVHVGVILLTAGIATGSMWAASSWGRYWGWDPKEVWSLIALLGYLTILHTRLDHDQRPWWVYLIGGGLVMAVFGLVGRHFLPVSGLTALAAAATLGAIAFLVLAQGRFATAVKSILCFWMIIMTYVGVNYVLGTGLHSYGFGTGAVVRYMIRIGVADLLVIGLLGAIHLLRQTPSNASTPEAAALPGK